MSLLSDEEIHEAIKSAKQVNHNYAGWVTDQRIEWARAIEAAILAKLASAELPEPQQYPAECFMQSLQVCDAVAVSIAIQKAHAQGFAAGAAAQLAEKPSAWKWKVNGCHQGLEAYPPPDDAYDEGTLIELYTRREAK